MSTRRGPRAALAIAVLVAIGAAACGSPAGSSQPEVASRTAPPGWTTVRTTSGDLQLTLPPWLVVFDDRNAIFANEPPPGPGAETPMQLMALGPGADGQPQPGEDLAAWIEGRLRDTGQGVPNVTRVDLPAGPAVRFDRTDRVGTPAAWRIVAFAIQTPRGVAFLQLDGPPESWAARDADLELVVLLFRVR